MENICRTIYGSRLQTSLLLGIPTPIATSSTLNEKFNIQSTTAINQSDIPAMKYVSIGNGGHKMVTGPNGVSKPDYVPHQPSDAALFNHLPFVLREITNDLSTGDRAKYGLRRIEAHNGVSYIAYYLKRLDYSDVTAGMDYKTVTNGATVTTAFIPNNSNLNPTPAPISNTGVNVATGNYISATAKVPFSLDATEVSEILNVANIIYGDDGYAIISEIGLCSGVDKLITVGAGGSNAFNFNEVIAAQVVSFMNCFFAMKFNNSGIDVLLDVGSTEPMGLI